MAHRKKKDYHPAKHFKTFREKVGYYMDDYRSRLGRDIDIFIILLNLAFCVIFVLNTYALSVYAKAVLWNLELIIVFFFIAEFIARLYGSTRRKSQLKDPYTVIDLVTILPTVLEFLFPVLNLGVIKLLRVFAVFRIFRFMRFFAEDHLFFGVIADELINISRLVFIILTIFFVSSGLFYYAESPANQEVQNFGDAFYFSVVALTTVGFGDITPSTDAGRMVTVLMIISGIILIPWQASLIVRSWIDASKKKFVVCPKCGLSHHDHDASHCKHCGHVLYRDSD
ncbi:MAG: ion transporter [Candidatus Aenigmatarchaeota archaeon]